MRSPRPALVANIAPLGLALCLGALACTPSQSTTPDPGAPGPTEPGTTEPAAPATPEPEATTTPPTDGTAEPASGSVALPPPSASAWNTGQSDGQPGKADRGITDYQRIIQDNREKFRSCYDAALAKQQGIKGRVTLVWVLDPAGAVRQGPPDEQKPHLDRSASDFHDDTLEKCMAAALGTLTFPPSKRGMDSTVRYPFDFQPKGRPPSR